MSPDLPDHDVTEQVRTIVARICRLDPAQVGDADRFGDDLGIDSLAKLEVVVQVERALGLRFDDDQAAAVESVDDLVRESRVSRAR